MESSPLLFDFLRSDDLSMHFERYSISIIYAVTYGFRVKSSDDPSIAEIHRVQDNLALAGAFGAWIVDAIPVLNHLPMALAPWKRSAEEWYKLESKIHLKHMDYGLKTKSWNWTKEFVSSMEGQGVDKLEMAYYLGILADAGLDTTVLQVFVLATLAQPSFLKEGKSMYFLVREEVTSPLTTSLAYLAQKELDAIIGNSRTPTLEDKANLEYTHACVKEVFRWRTILPYTFLHLTKQADTYMGYRIPSNSTIIPL